MSETSLPPDERSRRAWRLLRLAALGLLALAGLVVVLIVAGVFDPQPNGQLITVTTPGRVTVPGGQSRTIPQAAAWPAGAPPERFTARLTAAHAAGETDSGYGLALGDGRNRVMVAVSPPGYVAIWQEMGAEPTYLLPWQTWPHVRTGAAENEIWLDVAQIAAGAEVTAWVNREQLWRGALTWQPDGVALWLGSFGGPATVDFSALEWFAAP